MRTCTLEPAPLRVVEQWIAQHRGTWEQRELELAIGDVLDAADLLRRPGAQAAVVRPGNWPDVRPSSAAARFERFAAFRASLPRTVAYDLLLDHRLVSVSLTTIEFVPDGGGTRLVFTEQGAF